jgi:hypothetical protein
VALSASALVAMSVGETHTWPNSSDSRSESGKPAQLMVMGRCGGCRAGNGFGDDFCRRLSPVMSTLRRSARRAHFFHRADGGTDADHRD